MLAGTGKRSRKAKNHSLRVLLRKRSASGSRAAGSASGCGERFRLGFRDHLVGHRQLLDVVDPVRQRVVVGLGRPDPQHVQDDLGVLGVVLVPAVVQGLAGAGQGNRRDRPDVEAGLHQAPGKRAVVVAGRLETDGHRARQGLQLGHQPVVLGPGVGHRQPPAAPGIGDLDQTSLRSLATSMATRAAAGV
jgi:hypothetical protein